MVLTSYNLKDKLKNDDDVGIVKVINGSEHELTQNEERALSSLEMINFIDNEEEFEEIDDRGDRNDGLEYADRVLQRAKKQRRTIGSDENRRYPNLRWIPPTSNDAERLFFICKPFFSDFRTARTLEALIYLKVNVAYWDIKTVAAVLNAPRLR